MKKTVLFRFLACALAVSMLAGCGAASSSAPPAGSSGSGSASVGSGSSGAEKPAYAEITVEVFDRGTDGGKTNPTNSYYAEWIQKKVLEDENIGVTFVAVSRWEEEEGLNKLLAAGTAPDVSYTYNSDNVANYRGQGGLTNLAPYIEEYLPDLKEFLGPDPSVPGKDLIYREQLADSGDVYSIRARRMNTAAVGTFIRKDWLDALNLPVPTTTEEFYEALKAFKEQDPGGVGANNVIPFMIGSNDVRWRARPLLDSFIDPTLSDEDRWINTVSERELLLPGYKEGVRFLNQLYNEGLTDREFALTQGDEESDNIIKSGVVGAFMHNWDQAYRESPGLYRDILANAPDAEWISIDPFVNSAGKTYKNAYDPAGLHIIIPATCQNVEAALRYINWMAKFENYHFLQVGNEGVTHELVDGVPKLISAEGPEIMNSNQNIDYTMMINGLDLGSDELNAKALTFSYNVDAQLVLDAYNNAMKDAKSIMVVPGITFEKAGPVAQTLIDKSVTLMCEAVTAKPENFDAVWDSGIEDWLNAGAQEVIDERIEKLAETKS